MKVLILENINKFNQALNYRRMQEEKIQSRIDVLKAKLSETAEGSRAFEAYSQQIRDNERNLMQIKSCIEFMRPAIKEDSESRMRIQEEFPKIVKELFPDGFPIVFHGTSNIGTVREILYSGGLLTPEQRGVSMTSFASAIDVTYKDNIRVSCEFADAGTYMPYGAIFAFMPQEDEIENVVKTAGSSEVAGGVNGVNFREEPERLLAIITTPENYQRVVEWCNKAGIDPEKVLTHKMFINKYKEFDFQQEKGEEE